MQKCLWGVKDIKIPVLEKILREPWRNYLKLISIILDSQGFTQTVLRFLFRPVLFVFEIVAMTIAAAESSSLIYFQLK